MRFTPGYPNKRRTFVRMSSSLLVRMGSGTASNPLKSLERVKGIEPSSSAWKSLAAVMISKLIPKNAP
jgi:hypothetical protein